MKKTLFLNVVMALALFFLGGCFLDREYYFSYDELKNNVERVEIVEIEEWDLKNLVVLKSLDEEESDLILKELSEIRYTFLWGDPPEPNGICLKLYNADGTEDIISSFGTTVGKVSCSESEFMEMIERFLDSEQEAEAFQKN